MSTARSQGEAGRQPSAELLDDISPVTQDYLKTIWSATEWDDPPITASELAAKFGTTPAAVTDVVQRLAAQGLVKYQRYKPVRLTEQGERLAIGMVRRHRLLEMFLVNSLGYGWEEVHDEAERLEHAVSDDLIDRISRALGHPSHDPHGDPIPAPDGSTHRPLDAVRLAVASPVTTSSPGSPTPITPYCPSWPSWGWCPVGASRFTGATAKTRRSASTAPTTSQPAEVRYRRDRAP